MTITEDLQALTRNKWALAGVGVAAGAGLYVLSRRKAAGGNGTTTDTTTGQAATNGIATLDTSGTDIANWLGQYSSSLQNQLDQYNQELTDAITGLQQVPTTGSTAPPPPTTPPPVATTQPVGAPQPRPVSNPAYVTVAKFTSRNPPWNSTLSGIASHYHTSVSRLVALNPSISNPNVIRVGQKIRVS